MSGELLTPVKGLPLADPIYESGYGLGHDAALDKKFSVQGLDNHGWPCWDEQIHQAHNSGNEANNNLECEVLHEPGTSADFSQF